MKGALVKILDVRYWSIWAVAACARCLALLEFALLLRLMQRIWAELGCGGI